MEPDVAKTIASFFMSYKSYKYKNREVIIGPAHNPSGLLFLESGIVRQYSMTLHGVDITINTFHSPAIFPVGWIVNDTDVKHYYEACGEVKVWTAPKKDALIFFKNNPEVVFDLMQRIYRGLEGYFTRMESLLSGSAKTRLITYLLIHAKRFGQMEMKITESDLASQVGISRETVSRQLQKLMKEKLVNLVKGFLTVTDIKKLEEKLLTN